MKPNKNAEQGAVANHGRRLYPQFFSNYNTNLQSKFALSVRGGYAKTLCYDVMLNMTFPLILQTDDGLHWWNEASLLERSVESPDIENGIYKVWDSSGQIINLDPLEPVKHNSFFGINTVSVTRGVLSPSGTDDSEALLSALLFHFEDINNRIIANPMKLPEAVSLFCSLEPERKS